MRVDRNVELKWENMRRGIEAQVAWLGAGAATLHDLAGARLGGDPPPRVYLVGCGDSHYCGLATRLAFERWSGVPTEALESLEFSRYVVDHAPEGAWVVCVSNSGRVTRTVEAAIFARERGLVPVALTFDGESRLAQNAAVTLPFGYEDVGFGPGTLSYMASLSGLYAIALHLATMTGRADGAAAARRREVLAGQAQAVAAAIAGCDPIAAELGRATGADAPVHIIGAGPNYGTALFGMAKLIEAAATPAVGQELEEWAHEQYFCTGPGTLTMVLAPPGAALDRAREQLQAVRDVGGTAVAICAEDDAETRALADHVLPVPRSDAEELSPITCCVPLQLFAYHHAVDKGRTMLGFDDRRRMEVNFRQIFGSQIPVERGG
ncbi:MAG TPA: SIS domain-containing protein [Candidatus Dormibacteraeota bacterium]|nr:SIS domain-containing protein [Candidatus Dormibacteraeota bacterium]